MTSQEQDALKTALKGCGAVMPLSHPRADGLTPTCGDRLPRLCEECSLRLIATCKRLVYGDALAHPTGSCLEPDARASKEPILEGD